MTVCVHSVSMFVSTKLKCLWGLKEGAASSTEALKQHYALNKATSAKNKDDGGLCWGLQLPVIFSNDSQQLPADACIEAADTTCGLLDLGHLVLILKVDGLC